MSKALQAWIYKGVAIFPAPSNSSGIRWTATCGIGLTLKAESKQGMRKLITEYVGARN